MNPVSRNDIERLVSRYGQWDRASKSLSDELDQRIDAIIALFAPFIGHAEVAESRNADLEAKLAEAERRNAQHVTAYDELAAGMAEVAAQRDDIDGAVARMANGFIEGGSYERAIERHRSKAAGSHE